MINYEFTHLHNMFELNFDFIESIEELIEKQNPSLFDKPQPSENIKAHYISQIKRLTKIDPYNAVFDEIFGGKGIQSITMKKSFKIDFLNFLIEMECCSLKSQLIQLIETEEFNELKTYFNKNVIQNTIDKRIKKFQEEKYLKVIKSNYSEKDINNICKLLVDIAHVKTIESLVLDLIDEINVNHTSREVNTYYYLNEIVEVAKECGYTLSRLDAAVSEFHDSKSKKIISKILEKKTRETNDLNLNAIVEGLESLLDNDEKLKSKIYERTREHHITCNMLKKGTKFFYNPLESISHHIPYLTAREKNAIYNLIYKYIYEEEKEYIKYTGFLILKNKKQSIHTCIEVVKQLEEREKRKE